MDCSAVVYALIGGVLNGFGPMIFQAQGPSERRQMGLQFGAAAFALIGLGVIIAVARLPLGGWAFLGLGAIMGLGNIVNVVAYFSVVVHRGPVSVSWSIIWMGSVVMAILGWVVLREDIYLVQPIGLLCFIACLAVMGFAVYRTNLKSGAVRPVEKGYWLWLIVALLAGVVAAFVMGLRERLADRGHDFVFLSAGYVASLVLLAVYLAVRKCRPTTDRRTIWISLIQGTVQVTILANVLRGASISLSGFFPMLAGISILAGVAISFIRGERPSRLVYIGALLAILSVVLINLKGPVLVDW